MPSRLHETLVLLFQNQPGLAPDLLRKVLRHPLPAYSEARVESAELHETVPTEYRADAVVVMRRTVPVLGIVVEVQLQRRAAKRYVWPAYVASLRARLRCPVCLLVLTVRDDIARWAARPIDLGGGSFVNPLVVGPSGVPVVVDARAAARDPELAVLSAIAHGRRLPSREAARLALTAMAATEGLDEERSTMYFDVILGSLSGAARKELQAMEPAKYEYQSAFAKRYLGKGAADVVLKQLRLRFGELAEADAKRVRRASLADLDSYAERLLSAKTLADVWGPDAPSRRRSPRRRGGKP